MKKIKADNYESMSYNDYRSQIDNLLLDNKTTGTNHSDSYLNYTKMNVTRMKRLDKTYSFDENINGSNQRWIIITEAWCGDAAQNIPIIEKIANSASIETSYVLRDENLELIDEFLTNGGRSIPKLIAVNKDNEVLFDWGPRPSSIQDKFQQLKERGLEYSDISKEIHTMYARDKGEEMTKELLQLLSS